MSISSLHNEPQLVSELQTGSEEAFTALYRHYCVPLYNNIVKVVRDPESAEEIVQELFTRVWQKRESPGLGENFRGYIFRIAQNLVHDFFRRLKRDRKLMERFRLLAEESFGSSEEALQFQQTTIALRKAIDLLSPQQRKVYELIKLDGKTYREAAEILEISTHTVKEYLVSANKHIRRYFIQNGDLASLIFVAMMAGTLGQN